MRFPRAVLLAVTMPMCANSQPLDQAERERAVTELKASQRLLLSAVAGLGDRQWRFKPAPGRWSVAECAEHVALAEDHYYELITGKLRNSPPEPSKRAEVKGKDDVVLEKMPDRGSKRITAPALEPKGRWPGPAETLDHFQKSRDRLVHYVQTTNDVLRDHFQTHRAVGLIDAYQWILLASGHVRRHVRQIEEVKASPGFPAK